MSLRLRQAERFSPIFCLRLLALTVLVSPMFSSWPQAATPIESASQEYLLQQERERLLRQQQEQAPDVRLQAQAPQEMGCLPSDETPCFMIERIVLTGDTPEKFQWALAYADQTAEGESDPALQRSLGSVRILARID